MSEEQKKQDLIQKHGYQPSKDQNSKGKVEGGYQPTKGSGEAKPVKPPPQKK